MPFVIRSFLIGTLLNHENVYLVYPETTEARLSGTCFRGTDIECAGNFSLWATFEDMRRDKAFRELLEFEIMRAAQEYLNDESSDTRFDESIEIEHDQEVGWASTSPIDDFSEDDLEPFQPNKRVTGLKVRVDSGKLAPKTSLVTVVYSLYRHEDQMNWTAVIHSIYPGEDIGPLEVLGQYTDVSERERIAFFDWSHPGVAA